ncbi:hypothetical protein P280DRAFT_399607, partial [Massarina eburnea CBS 473.64]
APPQPSKHELEAAERQTTSDIKWTAASAVVLYLCKPVPPSTQDTKDRRKDKLIRDPQRHS